MRNEHKYLLLVAIVTALIWLPLFANFLVLRSAGEFMQLDDVAEYQQKTNALYGSALHDVRREHKLEIIRVRRPEVVALGSSRALDFRQEYFRKSFACACQAMSSILDAPDFLETMLAIHKPKLVIWNLDFWWFGRERLARDEIQTDGIVAISQQKILKPWTWVLNGKISVTDYFNILLGARNINNLTAYEKIGVQAIKRSVGIRKDGSGLHASWVLGLQKDETVKANERRFKNPKELLETSDGKYVPDQTLRGREFEILIRSVGYLVSEGVEVILLLPPVTPPVHQIMVESGRYQYVEDLSAKLAQVGVEYYDLRDAVSYGADACEFRDIHHGGNTVYMRMLKEIADRNPASILQQYVEPVWLDQAIKKFQGLIVAEFNGEKLLQDEVDFFELGCDKKGDSHVQLGPTPVLKL